MEDTKVDMEDPKSEVIVEGELTDSRRKSGRVAEKPVVEKPAKTPKKTKAEKKLVLGEGGIPVEGQIPPKPKRVRKLKAKASKAVAKTANPATGETKDGEETGTETATTGAGEEGEKKEVAAKKKPVKKTIPIWANVSDRVKTAGATTSLIDSVDVIVSAVEILADSKGMTSYVHLKKFIATEHSNWPKMTFKGALKRALDKERIKRIKNSFKVQPVKSSKANKKTDSKSSKNAAPDKGALEKLLPHVFTWVVEPKESSYVLIKKYIAKHFPHLDTEGKLFRKALENGVAKGQLEKLTGKGVTGTYQLMDGAAKTGTRFEDAIEDAIIATNEPKDCSFQALRRYLSELKPEFNVKEKPKVLMRALEHSEERGWIVRLSGSGMSGSFRLAYPYSPSPKELWGDEYKESDYLPKSKKQSTSDDDDQSSEDESSEEEEEEVYVPAKKSRTAPKARAPPNQRSAPKKSATKKTVAANKSPAKKVAAKKRKQ